MAHTATASASASASASSSFSSAMQQQQYQQPSLQQQQQQAPLTFWEIFSTDILLEAFKAFLESRQCYENLAFWLDIQAFKFLQTVDDITSITDRAQQLYARYIELGAPMEINIDASERKRIKDSLREGRRDVFDEARGSIYQLMVYDSVPKFANSKHYKAAILVLDDPASQKLTKRITKRQFKKATAMLRKVKHEQAAIDEALSQQEQHEQQQEVEVAHVRLSEQHITTLNRAFKNVSELQDNDLAVLRTPVSAAAASVAAAVAANDATATPTGTTGDLAFRLSANTPAPVLACSVVKSLLCTSALGGPELQASPSPTATSSTSNAASDSSSAIPACLPSSAAPLQLFYKATRNRKQWPKVVASVSLIQTSVTSRSICGFLVTIGKTWLGWPKRTRSTFKKRFVERVLALEQHESVDYLSYSLDSRLVPSSAESLEISAVGGGSAPSSQSGSDIAQRTRSASDTFVRTPSASVLPASAASLESDERQTNTTTTTSSSSNNNNNNTSALSTCTSAKRSMTSVGSVIHHAPHSRKHSNTAAASLALSPRSHKRTKPPSLTGSSSTIGADTTVDAATSGASSSSHTPAAVVEARKSRQVPLLQLLDLVNSLLKQYATHFEFTETFILFLVSQLCYGLPGQDAPPLTVSCSIYDLIDYVLANRIIFVNKAYDAAASMSISVIANATSSSTSMSSLESARSSSASTAAVLLPMADADLCHAVNEHLAGTLRMVPRAIARDLHILEEQYEAIRAENSHIRSLCARVAKTMLDMRQVLQEIEARAEPVFDAKSPRASASDGTDAQAIPPLQSSSSSRITRSSMISSVLGMRGLRRSGSSKDILVKPLASNQTGGGNGGGGGGTSSV
jgi:hypothetical protein